MINLEQRKKMLKDKLQELTDRAEEINDDLREAPEDDWSDNAIEAADDEVLEEVGDVTRVEIRQIKRALSQIENGTYGVCTTCGIDIPEPPLDAVPHTTQCVACA